MTVLMDEASIEDEVYSLIDLHYYLDYGRLDISKNHVSVDGDSVVVELYGSIKMTLHHLIWAMPDDCTNSVIEGFFEAQEELYDYEKDSMEFKSIVDEIWNKIENDKDNLLDIIGNRMFGVAEELESDLKNSKALSDGKVEVSVNFGHVESIIPDFTKEGFKELVFNYSR